jgi:hypothetical protein
MSPLTREDDALILGSDGSMILLEGETGGTTDPRGDPGRPDLTFVEVSSPDTDFDLQSGMAISGFVDQSEQPFYGVIDGWARADDSGRLLYDIGLLYDTDLLYGTGGGLVFSPTEYRTGVIER